MKRLALLPTLGVVCLGLFGREATAQSGPGLPNLLYDASEEFTVLSEIVAPNGGSTKHNHSFMNDGYLTIIRHGHTSTAPSDGIEFYDISNPYNPKLVHSVQENVSRMVEAHTLCQTRAYGGQHVIMARGSASATGAPANAGTGIEIWDFTDIFHAHRVGWLDLPGVTGTYPTGVFWMSFQGPYIYVPAASLGLFIVDATDPANPLVVKKIPVSQTGGFTILATHAVGNWLIGSNAHLGTGRALFDISDPLNPILLHATTQGQIPYGSNVNGNHLFVPITNGTFLNYEITPTGFILKDTIDPPGNRGAQVDIQDGFAHVGLSTSYAKIDISDPSNMKVVGSYTASNPTGDEDYSTPLGNLIALSDDEGFGTDIIVHQIAPDNTGPSVTMVVPQNGATNQAITSRIGITVTDMIELLSLDTTTFMVRPVGGQAVSGKYTHQFGIVNFSPDEPLLENTTYEVVIPAGGIRDWTGNPTPTTFISRFSTGEQTVAIGVVAERPSPTVPAEQVTFSIASISGVGPFQYSWNFGDGTPSTTFSSSSSATHTYAGAGHYTVIVTATNGMIPGTDSFIHLVHNPTTSIRPTRSSTIVLDDARSMVWCVNADNDTVTAIDSQNLTKLLEVPVGTHPRTLAKAPEGTIWVVCQDDATVHVLDPVSGATLETIALPYASAPYGVAMAPDGAAAYVTLRATGQVAKLDPALRTLVGTTDVGPEPKGIAIASDSERIFVTRFLSSAAPSPLSVPPPKTLQQVTRGPLSGSRGLHVSGPGLEPVAEIYELSGAAFARVRTIPLALDPGPDTEASGRGLPNYLNSLTISPDGLRLWAPSKKDNIKRGLFRSGELLDFQNTVRTIASQVDLGTNQEILASRIDFNDADVAFAVELSPLGDYVFAALQGSNTISVHDVYSGANVADIPGTGLAPQGLVMTSDGSTLYVHNFMSRTVSAFDVSGVTSSTVFGIPSIESPTSLVAEEKLTPEVLKGKQIFYNARDPRMNQDGYLSCATCHLDGGHDGQTWDFTERGEGLRNNITLLGRAGTGHGNVHWTANFDEIQDFENDIRAFFSGDGFMENAIFNSSTVSNPLGHPKAGLSPSLVWPTLIER